MATSTPPLSPRKELRNILVDVDQQKANEGKMCLQLVKKVHALMEESQANPNSKIDPTAIGMLASASKSLALAGLAKEKAYCQCMAGFTQIYLDKGGAIEDLADALLGDAPEKEAFIAQQKALQGIVRLMREMNLGSEHKV